MSSIKKFSLISLLFLLILSFLHDLSKHNPVHQEQSSNIADINNTEIAHIKIEPGDTVLSITEEVNNDLPSLDINKIIADFQKLNPGADPKSLIPYSFYYFPLYNDS